jgi:Uma2 family endonuclease
MTAEGFMKLPDDGYRHELVKGELAIAPLAKKQHGRLESRILRLLFDYVAVSRLGEVTTGNTGYFIFRNPDTIRAPDIGFIQAVRAAIGGDSDGYWEFAPDLAIEILSPTDTYGAVQRKIDDWLDAGTRLVWVVDPERKTVAVFAPDRGPRTYRDEEHLGGEDVLPGFDLALSEIFK